MGSVKKSFGFAVWVLLFLVALALNHASVDRAGPPDGDVPPAPVDTSQIQKFDSEELHTLVLPIALYPDALLAQVLPASAYPLQIVDAYRFVQGGGNPDVPPAGVTWDSSVMALLHYPSVLRKLNDDLKWTEQLGVAATYQMDDVSEAIQQVRAEAHAVGNLQSNDRELVQVDDGAIEIVPANPEVIYVPEYDPSYICERRLDSPFIWGTGFGYGLWLGNTWDWHHHRIWVNNFWGRDGWHRSPRAEYWRAPARELPSWYTRSGSRGLVGKRIVPRGFTPRVENRAVVVPHAVVAPHVAPHVTIDHEDLRNRGVQTHVESLRGQASRNVIRPAPVVAPRVERRVEPARPVIHESIQSDRGTVNREASRGAASRGGGGGGGGKRK